MADLYLVRHGQASFGAADYDRLSSLGEDQARRLGAWIAACGVRPDAVASGPLLRQTHTAELAMAAAGAPAQADLHILDGLGEYDHDAVFWRLYPQYQDRARLAADLAGETHPRRAFHRMYEQAVARWVKGEHDADYDRTWPQFRDGCVDALRILTTRSEKSIWAFTSGGPITAVVQHLLTIPDARAFEVNWPLVNTGVTRLRFSAGQAASLSYFNAFPHLDQAGDPALITYR